MKFGAILFLSLAFVISQQAHAVDEAKIDYTYCKDWINENPYLKGLLMMEDTGKFSRPNDTTFVIQNGVSIVTTRRKPEVPIGGPAGQTVDRIDETRRAEVKRDAQGRRIIRDSNNQETLLETVKGKCVPTDVTFLDKKSKRMLFLASSRLCHKIGKFIDQNEDLKNCNLEKVAQLDALIREGSKGYDTNYEESFISSFGALGKGAGMMTACQVMKMDKFVLDADLWDDKPAASSNSSSPPSGGSAAPAKQQRAVNSVEPETK